MTSFLIRWTEILYYDSELSPFTKGFIRQVENLNNRRYDVGLMHCYSTASYQQCKRTRNKRNAYKHILAITKQTKHRYTIPTETHTQRGLSLYNVRMRVCKSPQKQYTHAPSSR